LAIQPVAILVLDSDFKGGHFQVGRRRSKVVRFLDWSDLYARGIKHSKTQINRMVRQGLFPRPVKLGHSTKVWVESEIEEYQASVIAKRDAEQNARSNQKEGEERPVASPA
jgi:prophage regulatory protein